VIGVSAGYSGFVVGHELIHRREKHLRFLGRVVLASNCYEHFSTEHIRGHHPRVGTAADPATARFGITYNEFFRRTVPAQFKSAWHLEKVRLGDENLPAFDLRWLQHRVFQGVVVEVAMLVGIAVFLGPSALVAFLLCALTAIRLLEAVNYFEHWGLVRKGKGVRTMDSWDTDSWFTLYTLVGLSRHADHHAIASRPYEQLRYFEDSPKLPFGYFGMVVTAVARNERFQELMTEELKRKKLGPFYEEPAVTSTANLPVVEPSAAE
jgi:alkane 1-monooxygenase